MKEVERISETIEFAIENRTTYEFQPLFSPTRFAMRLGETFYDLPSIDRQYAYSMFRQVFEDELSEYFDYLYILHLKVKTFDISKDGEVYRLIYKVTDATEKYTHNYLIFYVEKDNGEEFKIVNFYNVMKGFSTGQAAKQILTNVVSNESVEFTNRLNSANRNISRAVNLMAENKPAEAYDILKKTDPKIMRLGSRAFLNLIVASQVSDSVHLEELRRMQKLTPNDQSKILYDCLINRVKDFELKFGDCGEKLEKKLLKT